MPAYAKATPSAILTTALNFFIIEVYQWENHARRRELQRIRATSRERFAVFAFAQKSSYRAKNQSLAPDYRRPTAGKCSQLSFG